MQCFDSVDDKIKRHIQFFCELSSNHIIVR